MEETNLTPPPEPMDDDQNQSPQRPSVMLWSVLVAVAFALGLVTGYLLWERPLQARIIQDEQKMAALQMQKTAVSSATDVAGATAVAEANQNQQEVPQQVKRYDVPIDDDPILGNEKAPITIIEFSDYECPFCLRWHQEVLPQIQKAYGDKVRLIYRDFPLYGLHNQAEAAAEAANCAGEQKLYWEYHSLLFSGQKQLSTDTFAEYAQTTKLNVDDFKKCMTEHRFQKEVKADYDYASQLGVRSTPTFFINGLAVVGAQPFEVFQQVIDMELAGKIPK